MGVLGPKQYTEYKSDNAKTYNTIRRQADMSAVGNIPAASRSSNPSLPRFLSPRGVHLVDTLGNRRFVIIGDPTNAIYLSGIGPIAIDGASWSVTGRKGEVDRGGTSD